MKKVLEKLFVQVINRSAVVVCMGTVPSDPRPVTRLSRIIPVVSDILVTAMCAPAGQDDGS